MLCVFTWSEAGDLDGMTTARLLGHGKVPCSLMVSKLHQETASITMRGSVLSKMQYCHIPTSVDLAIEFCDKDW